jgi:hypothetical protein
MWCSLTGRFTLDSSRRRLRDSFAHLTGRLVESVGLPDPAIRRQSRLHFDFVLAGDKTPIKSPSICCSCRNLKIVAVIEQPTVIERILTHFGLSARLPPHTSAAS